MNEMGIYAVSIVFLALVAFIKSLFKGDEKLEILKELDEMGVGYSSRQSCEKDGMGLGISFDEVKNLDIKYLKDFKNGVKNENT